MGLIAARLYELITSDRDHVEKSKKAFVSYIRAYKEHELRYIFEFKNIDIGQIANSFFLFRIPRVKEILGRTFVTFKQHEIDIESIPWVDKNQKTQYMSKQEHREQQRDERDEQAKAIKDIKNVKSKRKKVRRRNEERERTEMNKMHREILKDKRALTKTKKQRMESEDSDDDTEQIERRVAERNGDTF